MVQPGLILVNKPRGMTSFQLLGPLKRKFGTKKIGHAGTLDKFAEGLMLVFVSKATRFVQYLSNADKDYTAVFQFGSETTTLDPEGEVIAEAEVPELTALTSVLDDFRGIISQKPPMFSAIHIDGKRAYQRALSGETPDIPSREVEISKLELDSYQNGNGRFHVSCSKGTYIRSLARDIGLASGSRAYVTELQRTRVGSFLLDAAYDLDTIMNMSDVELRASMIWDRSLLEAAGAKILYRANSQIICRICNGKPVMSDELDVIEDAELGMAGILDESGQIAALMQKNETGQLKYLSVFASLDNKG